MSAALHATEDTMSKTTLALETAVAAVIANMPKDDGDTPTARRRRDVDKAFQKIMKLIAPRIRHFVRQYGLMAHWDDAEQVCAIAVYRAIQSYDPAKAQFTTYVNWQIRGELQSLRFRLMTDQRPSAQKVQATTVSLHASTQGSDEDETTLESLIQDEEAETNVEAGASDYLAREALHALIDSYIDHLRNVGMEQLKRRPRPKRRAVQDAGQGGAQNGADRPKHAHGIESTEIDALEQRLKRDRQIIEGRLLDASGEIPELADVSKERARQISKRAIRTIGEIAGSDPKFQVMADYHKVGVLRSSSRTVHAEAGAPAMPPPPFVILPELVDDTEEWSCIRGEKFHPAALEASDRAAGAMGIQSVLRH